MANTLEQFKDGMSWLVLELVESQLDEIFESVDYTSYEDSDSLEEDCNIEDNMIFYDINLHSVLESYSELIERGLLRYLTFYHLADDDMYAGVLTYDIWV